MTGSEPSSVLAARASPVPEEAPPAGTALTDPFFDAAYDDDARSADDAGAAAGALLDELLQQVGAPELDAELFGAAAGARARAPREGGGIRSRPRSRTCVTMWASMML